MKITHFTDTHYRLKSPRSRKPGYFDQLVEKTEYIFDNENDSDFFVVTGDISHTAHWSESLFNEISKLFSNAPAPILIILGNHDMEGKVGSKSIWLKNLRFIDNIKYIEDEEPLYVTDKDEKVAFIARNFKRSRDGNIDQFIVDDLSDEFINIGLFHTYVLENHSNFIDHVLIDDVLEKSNLDVILNGHYHESLVEENNDSIYINPGSLARGVCNEHNKSRIPKYSVINVNDSVEYELREIEVARPWDEVVHDFYETNKEKTVDSDNIKETVKTIKERKNTDKKSSLISSYKDICRDIDQENLIDDGVRMIEKAENDLS